MGGDADEPVSRNAVSMSARPRAAWISGLRSGSSALNTAMVERAAGAVGLMIRNLFGSRRSTELLDEVV
jgi:hypothetical protein